MLLSLFFYRIALEYANPCSFTYVACIRNNYYFSATNIIYPHDIVLLPIHNFTVLQLTQRHFIKYEIFLQNTHKHTRAHIDMYITNIHCNKRARS